jgi:hypothetical protein
MTNPSSFFIGVDQVSVILLASLLESFGPREAARPVMDFRLIAELRSAEQVGAPAPT